MKSIVITALALSLSAAGIAQVKPVKKAASAATKVAAAPVKKTADKVTDVGGKVANKGDRANETAKDRANENAKFNRGDERSATEQVSDRDKEKKSGKA